MSQFARIPAVPHIEDLEQEGNQEIRFQILQCQPKELTIFENEWQDSA